MPEKIKPISAITQLYSAIRQIPEYNQAFELWEVYSSIIPGKLRTRDYLHPRLQDLLGITDKV